ncbi:Flp pilus assembly complex ATPase component TadA [Candidatus Magnetomoraceae bacterium gMMP-15]
MALLGEVLLEKEIVSPQKLRLALQEQKRTGELLGNTLVRLGSLTQKELSQVIASAAGIPFVNLNKIPVDAAAIKLVPRDIAKKYNIMPFELKDDKIRVGMDNPDDVVALDTLRRITQKEIEIFVADLQSIMESIGIYYDVGLSLEDEIDKNISAAIAGVVAEGEVNPPIVRLIELFLIKAIRERATDIHLSPQEMATSVSYRVDGILRTGSILPKQLHSSIVTRVKVMSGLNIAEQRLPQDGNIVFEFSGRHIDIRTSTSPCDHGENVVLRVLDKANILLGMGHLGLNKEDQQTIQKLTIKPHGIVLAAGPTGAGKTTTLYSMLKEINALEKNVLTIEDPIEYRLPLIKQTQVNEQAGLTFLKAIRHFLRQDPDIILVGEIRDLDTAKIAFQAAMTGHLVISTIHTNDASSCIARLLDLGVEAYLIPSCLRAVVSQRLVRKICPDCIEEYIPSEEELKLYDLQEWKARALKYGKGCPACGDTGYRGRTGIYEILEVSPGISNLITKKASSDQILIQAKLEGMQTMREDGLNKVLEGITTLEEVARVTG